MLEYIFYKYPYLIDGTSEGRAEVEKSSRCKQIKQPVWNKSPRKEIQLSRSATTLKCIPLVFKNQYNLNGPGHLFIPRDLDTNKNSN